MNEILGCTRCGAVSRSDSLDGKPDCPECGARMRRISIEKARRYVAARRRNDERERARLAAAEIGLSSASEVV